MPVIGAGLHYGAHAALQRYLGQDVVPQIARWPAGGRAGRPRCAIFKDLLVAGDEAGAQHVIDAEGLARRGARQGGVVRNVRELLLQLQIVQVRRLPS